MMEEINPERGNKDDVDLGMPEEPEDMLIEQRVAAFRGIDEMRADGAVVQQENGARHHHRRHGEDDHERLHQHAPAVKRNAVERHAGRAHLKDRGDELGGHAQGRDLRERDHLRPDIDAFSGRDIAGRKAAYRRTIRHRGRVREGAPNRGRGRRTGTSSSRTR